MSCQHEETKISDRGNNWTLKTDSTIRYSKRFSIATTPDFKLLFLFGNKDNRDTTAVFVLYNGNTPPLTSYKNSYSVKVPVNNVACMSSVYVAMLSKLNCSNKIVAIENSDYYNDSYILSEVNNGKIKELSKGPEINIEQTLQLHPALILTFGMGNPQNDINEKILKAGIPVAISLDHLEEHPLARAEWIKFMACFFDKKEMADSLFNITETSYKNLKRLTDTVKVRPTVLTEIKYADAWYVPGGKSFMAHLLNDAGSNYLWKENNKTGSLPLTFEDVFSTAGKADYWINLFININTKKELLAFDERYTLFNAFKKGNLYNNNKISNSKGYSDYWASGMTNPDELLKDLISIFHPELLNNHTTKYYKKIE